MDASLSTRLRRGVDQRLRNRCRVAQGRCLTANPPSENEEYPSETELEYMCSRSNTSRLVVEYLQDLVDKYGPIELSSGPSVNPSGKSVDIFLPRL